MSSSGWARVQRVRRMAQSAEGEMAADRMTEF